MANKFDIVISATDKGTAVVQAFNKKFDKMLAPVARTNLAFKRLGKELGKNQIVRGLGTLTKGATVAASKLGTVAAAVAGVGTAISGAAIANWGAQWAANGAAVQRFSNITGIASTRVQTLSGAAAAFGLDAKDMQAGLKGLGDTMEDALFGRNQDALILLNRLHIRVKRTKDGAVDAAAGLLDIAGAITKIKNVQAQGLVARTFGMEALLPLLQKGPAGIKQLEKLVAATRAAASPEQLKAMQEWTEKIGLLKLSVQGLGNSIGDRLLPYLSPATQKLTDFIQKTSDAIAQHKEILLWEAGKKKVIGGPGKTGGAMGHGGILGTGAHFSGKGTGEGLGMDWLNPFRWIPGFAAWQDANNAALREAAKRAAASGGTKGIVGAAGKGPLSEAAMQAFLKKAFPGVDIRSGFRTDKHNREVGGAARSYHLLGQAVDFRGRGLTREMIRRVLQAAHLPITELLDEGDHFHWAWGDPRRKRGGASGLAGALANARNGTGGGSASKPAHVVVQFKNAPPGMTAEVASKGGSTSNVGLRIDYSLPTVQSP